jgi:hypothetical protein
MIESPENAEQLDIAKGYLRACMDVIDQCASIKPIRANYRRRSYISCRQKTGPMSGSTTFVDSCSTLVSHTRSIRLPKVFSKIK